MRTDPLEVAAWELVTGALPSEDLPGLAIDALLRGVDSPTLAELAAQSPPDVRTSHDLFRQFLDELGIDFPTQDQAQWSLVRLAADAIVEAEVSPEVGVDRIWQCYRDDFEHSGDLRLFERLANDLADYPEDRADLEREIVAEARSLLRRSQPRVWIQVMAVAGRSALSRRLGYNSSSVSALDLPLGEELRSDLARWSAEHAASLLDWPRSGGFVSLTDAVRFVNAGQQLASRVQAELGPDYYVEYVPEPTQLPAVRLRAV